MCNGTGDVKRVPMQSLNKISPGVCIMYKKSYHVCHRALLLKLTCRVCDPRDSPVIRLSIYCTEILFVNMTRRVKFKIRLFF